MTLLLTDRLSLSLSRFSSVCEYKYVSWHINFDGDFCKKKIENEYAQSHREKERFPLKNETIDCYFTSQIVQTLKLAFYQIQLVALPRHTSGRISIRKSETQKEVNKLQFININHRSATDCVASVNKHVCEKRVRNMEYRDF